MREVRLYGHLAKKFGKVFRFSIETPAEAIRALKANFPNFEKELLSHDLGYHVFVNDRNIGKEELTACGSSGNVIKIVPVVAGQGSGVFKVILGAVLVVVGVVYSQPWMVSMGASLVIGGVSQMLMKPPSREQASESNRSPSYSFNGPVNTSDQGHPVPVCYGRLIVGSQVISAGLSVDQIAV